MRCSEVYQKRDQSFRAGTGIHQPHQNLLRLVHIRKMTKYRSTDPKNPPRIPQEFSQKWKLKIAFGFAKAPHLSSDINPRLSLQQEKKLFFQSQRRLKRKISDKKRRFSQIVLIRITRYRNLLLLFFLSFHENLQKKRFFSQKKNKIINQDEKINGTVKRNWIKVFIHQAMGRELNCCLIKCRIITFLEKLQQIVFRVAPIVLLPN